MDHETHDAFERLTQRVRVIEANIAVLARNAGLQMEASAADAIPPDVVELATAGRTIDAIKRYRELVPSASLADAKAVVDAI